MTEPQNLCLKPLGQGMQFLTRTDHRTPATVVERPSKPPFTDPAIQIFEGGGKA